MTRYLAIIMRGAQGIRRAPAHRLADAGVDLCWVDRDLESFETTAAELQNRGVQLVHCVADVTKRDDI